MSPALGSWTDQTLVCLFYFYRGICGFWTNPHCLPCLCSFSSKKQAVLCCS